MLTFVWIALGGALGSVARYSASLIVARQMGSAFPWGTLLVNVLGSLVIGFVAMLTGPDGRMPTPIGVRHFIMVGVLGGFTTFSAFSLQTLELAQNGKWLQAGANVIGSVALCLVAVWIGHVLAAGLGQRP